MWTSWAWSCSWCCWLSASWPPAPLLWTHQMSPPLGKPCLRAPMSLCTCDLDNVKKKGELLSWDGGQLEKSWTFFRGLAVMTACPGLYFFHVFSPVSVGMLHAEAGVGFLFFSSHNWPSAVRYVLDFLVDICTPYLGKDAALRGTWAIGFFGRRAGLCHWMAMENSVFRDPTQSANEDLLSSIS